MNWKLSTAALLLGSAIFTIAGCAADATDVSNDEEAAATQDELTASASRLVGAFHGAGGSERPPTFEGIVFKSNGQFFADLDTGIRCITTPCPSNVRLVGNFKATRSFITLSPANGEKAHDFYGRYRYTLADGQLSLTRNGTTWERWNNKLVSNDTYCVEATDCAGQNMIVPACLGRFTCGEQRSCGFTCGVVANEIWPSDATKIVAKSPGGGFVPPAPPGSTCAFGAHTYSLDVASGELSWEVCGFHDDALHLAKGKRALTTSELDSVVAAAKGLTISKRELCGADKPFLTVDITSASQGQKTYIDSFYSCMGKGTYVDGIDTVFGALSDLTRN